jgi:hypothetical protein
VNSETAPNADQITSASGKGKRILVALLVVFAGIAAVPLLQSERMTDVNQEMLDAAVAKWSDNHPKSYDATISVEGAMPGQYRINVRDGKVESVSFNNSPLTLERTREVWTCDGMLRMVEQDLMTKVRLAAAGNETFVTRVYFDPNYGFPKRYLRLDYHTKSTVTWNVAEFDVR